MNKLAVFVLLVAVAACSNKKPEEGREPAQTGAPGATVGSAVGPSASGAANGGAPTGNAPGGPTGSAPAPGGASPPGSVGCATATTLVCGADQADGCTGGLTAVHVCIAKDAKAGPPCAQELALSCPAGQVDACLHNPPQANNHLCVTAPTSTP